MTSLQNLPIPGFTASKEWGNQWNVGTNQDVTVYLDHVGRMRLEKKEKFTLHTVLAAYAEDLEAIREGYGVLLNSAAAYTVSLSTRNDRGVRSTLVLHEFDATGKRVSRLTVSNGERALFVPTAMQGTLALSLRIVGAGGAVVEAIEFNPTNDLSAVEPGLHSLPALSRGPEAPKPQVSDVLGRLMPIRRALYDGVSLSVILSRAEAQAVVSSLLKAGHPLEAKEIVRQFNLYGELQTSILRKLFWHGRRAGYLAHALACMNEVVLRSGRDSDREAAERVRTEYEFHLDPWNLMPDLHGSDDYDPQGPVLHMVGKSLPERQTGYTVRTKYTVAALRRSGIESVIAVQSGGNHDEGLAENLEHEVEGVRTVMLRGPAKKDVSREEWLTANTQALHELVRSVRPSVIHAHSDFANGALATHVGEASGVPVIYESRGFWEETWISRVSKAQGWEDIDLVIRMYGAPDLYELRRRSERRVRERADRVVTLAQTMKDFILQESEPERVLAEHVYLARNAVDPDDFPAGAERPAVRRALGIKEGAVVVGYISSIVEYEGIETLIDGYRLLQRRHPNTRLLIVGDGPYLNRLRQRVERAGLEGVIFTGRVPHEEVLEYYHSIDVFVVPRRKTRVTELVTPLKPFEAFSTGRPVVVSDVAALAEIADDSHGIARQFTADDPSSLAETLAELVVNPELRSDLGRRGAEWVRQERSWDANVPMYRRAYEDLRTTKYAVEQGIA